MFCVLLGARHQFLLFPGSGKESIPSMASFTVPSPKSSSLVYFGSSANNATNQKQQNVPKILDLSSGSSLSRLRSVGFQCSKRRQIAAWKVKASLNEGTSEKPSQSTPNNGSVTKSALDEASISAFMAQVSDLVKLVDSKDITELNLKQLDCELIIRKKEALEPPPVMAMPPTYHSVMPDPPPLAPVTAPSVPASSAPALPPPAPKKPTGSSHPPLKCPMAGTFYRSPAPGEPALVKVGDKVQKGQVICIIEAMKLMNEIEADHSGTIAEILVDDGKPVSVDMPLFVIAPP